MDDKEKTGVEGDLRRLKRVGPLNTPGKVSSLMGKTIRQAIRGEIDMKEAKSIVWMLKQTGDLLRQDREDELDKRIDAIEEALGPRVDDFPGQNVTRFPA